MKICIFGAGAIGGYLAVPGDAQRTKGPDAVNAAGGGSGHRAVRQGDIP